jgi:broad specificity phosphatase PhoE
VAPGFGLNSVYSSPLRRAWETAEIIATASRVGLHRDVRLRERMNWDGSRPLADFMAEWERSTQDRDYVPSGGDSSVRAGDRLRAFLLDVIAEPGPVAAATHGGVTVDLLLTLLGDDGLPPRLLDDWVRSVRIGHPVLRLKAGRLFPGGGIAARPLRSRP